MFASDKKSISLIIQRIERWEQKRQWCALDKERIAQDFIIQK